MHGANMKTARSVDASSCRTKSSYATAAKLFFLLTNLIVILGSLYYSHVCDHSDHNYKFLNKAVMGKVMVRLLQYLCIFTCVFGQQLRIRCLWFKELISLLFILLNWQACL